mmetsp:Transcript_6947/g.25337  ORF Transcript_6947/g.25337 Transcript_6947/m.25337 type:complete len:166 (+) Transcript_6947:103-600(+)
MLCSITRASAATSNSGCSIRRAPRLSPSRGACGTCTHRTRTTRRHASTSGDGDVIGVVVVDHGSRRAASNAQLEAFAEAYTEATGRAIVEAAHMELAAPTIGEAFGKCVARGANFIVVAPFFLITGTTYSGGHSPTCSGGSARARGCQVFNFCTDWPASTHDGSD